MKRFASHYLYIPSCGFLKQYVVEINEEGFVVKLYPLKEEVESIIWTPGIIRLMSQKCLFEVSLDKKEYLKNDLIDQVVSFDHNIIRKKLPVEYNDVVLLDLVAIRLYPFDLTQMKSVENTSFQLLDWQIF